MDEREFTDYFIKTLNLSISPFQIATKKSVLYQIAINDKGHVDMGVDIDSGEPIRGGGKGFEQDILIYEEKEGGHTSFIPRVIAEVKLGKVTTQTRKWGRWFKYNFALQKKRSYSLLSKPDIGSNRN